MRPYGCQAGPRDSLPAEELRAQLQQLVLIPVPVHGLVQYILLSVFTLIPELCLHYIKIFFKSWVQQLIQSSHPKMEQSPNGGLCQVSFDIIGLASNVTLDVRRLWLRCFNIFINGMILMEFFPQAAPQWLGGIPRAVSH